MTLDVGVGVGVGRAGARRTMMTIGRTTICLCVSFFALFGVVGVRAQGFVGSVVEDTGFNDIYAEVPLNVTSATIEDFTQRLAGGQVSFVVNHDGSRLAFELAHAPRGYAPIVSSYDAATGRKSQMDPTEVEDIFECIYRGHAVDDAGAHHRARATLCDGQFHISVVIDGDAVEFKGRHDAPTSRRSRSLGERMPSDSGAARAVKLTARRAARNDNAPPRYNVRDDVLFAPNHVRNASLASTSKIANSRRRLNQAVTRRYLETVVYVGTTWGGPANQGTILSTLNDIWAAWQDIFDATTEMNPPGTVVIAEVIIASSSNVWGADPSTIKGWLQTSAENIITQGVIGASSWDNVVSLNDYGSFNGGTIGLAYVGTVCETFDSNKFRFSVNSGGVSDPTWYLSQLIAHEVGHNLGFFHDGSKPGCSEEAIMAPCLGCGSLLRYSHGSGCDADIWNSGEMRDPSTNTLFNIDYSCLENVCASCASNPPPPPSTSPSPPPITNAPPSFDGGYPSPPPPLGTNDDDAVDDGVAEYVTSSIDLSGMSATDFSVANRRILASSLAMYFGLAGRQDAVTIVSVESLASSRRRSLLQSAATRIKVRVLVEQDAERTTVVSKLQTANDLTNAVREALPAVTAVSANDIQVVYVVQEDAPDEMEEEFKSHAGGILAALGVVFVIIPGVILYFAFRYPNGRLGNVCRILFGEEFYRKVRSIACCFGCRPDPYDWRRDRGPDPGALAPMHREPPKKQMFGFFHKPPPPPPRVSPLTQLGAMIRPAPAQPKHKLLPFT
jgi:hypothetical protein